MIPNRRKIDPKEYFKRPARKQITGDNHRTMPVNDGVIYNIYYNRYTGGDKPRFSQIERSNTRCVISRDAGKTKSRPKAFHCLHFARGGCSRGADCIGFFCCFILFIHNVPLTDTIDRAYDCFGRERYRLEKEDMSGVGSFEKENKILYVGNVTIGNSMEELVARHFSEWGEIEHIRILQGRGIAFVRYAMRSSAEFAKEAMFGQSLDGNEILNVRWAQDDPNPHIKEDIKRKAEERVYAAIEEKLPEVGELGSVLAYQGYYDDPVTKKLKNEENKELIQQEEIAALDKPEHVRYDDSQYYENYAVYEEDNSAYAYQYDDQPQSAPVASSSKPQASAAPGLVAYGDSDEE